MNMNYPPGLREHEARMDHEQALEVAAEPVAADLRDALHEAADTFLADLPLPTRHAETMRLRSLLGTWSQGCAELLLEARAREAEPIGGWEQA